MDFCNRKTHELKISPDLFYAVADMSRPFDVLKNDCSYKIGDLVVFREWDCQSFTGRSTSAREITCIEGLGDGYIILGFRVF